MGDMPWPLKALAFLLSFFSRQETPAPPTDEAVFLLKFKETLISGGGGSALQNWVKDGIPCRGSAAVWVGVFCTDNSNVSALQLDSFGLSGELMTEPLIGLPSLQTLSFQNNSFSGAMPDISNLRTLTSIDFSCNNFTGEIADGMFEKMPHLKKVYLSDNNFSGAIPSSLTRLKELQELRLDDNAFQGDIPNFKQTSLQLANLSYNNLEGRISDGLSKMNPSMFEGNKHLCGPPLAVLCTSSKLSRGILALIIVISILLVLAILALVFLLIRVRKKQKQLEIDSPTSTKSTKKLSDKVGFHMEFVKGKIPKEEHSKLVFVREDRPKFGLQDLLRASGEVLGSGNFGSSYKATLLHGPVFVAKSFKEMNRAKKEEFSEHMRKLGKLSHPNMLPLVAYYYRKEEKVLVTDYISNGSLAHMLHGNNGSYHRVFDWPTRLKIVKGVARGLTYLYQEFPMAVLPHGHLKSSNVLLDSSFEPILTDYALVPVMSQSHASRVMIAFKSPECTKTGKPSRKSDVWSFGILILEILTGKFPMDYLLQGGGDTDLVSWVNSVVQEEFTVGVFDKSMHAKSSNEEEMQKLLHIGMAACDKDVQLRLDMTTALERIEQIQVEGTGEGHSTCLQKSSLKDITDR